MAPVQQNEYILIPQGSIVYGRVSRTTRVGYGLRHERAAIGIEFQEWEHPNGMRHRLHARLLDVDNAREQVSSDGRIRGILAAGGAPGFMLGMWRWPEPSMLARTAGGFAGLSYFMLEKLPFAPLSIAGIITTRFLIVRWPEPEIHLPPGTDLLLSLLELPASGHVEKAPEPAEAPPGMASLVSSQPFRTARAKSFKPSDTTNFVFVGTRQQVELGFLAAGWHPAESVTRGSAMRVIRAITAQHGYPTAPMSPLLLEGQYPDLTFQKSLNTLSKRHHIRIWQRPELFEGQPVWVGAATQDTGIRIHPGGKGLTHQIDPFIDRERRKIINDLSFAGCVEQQYLVDRTDVTRAPVTDIVTDGRVAALHLKDCEVKQFTPWGQYPPPPAQGSVFKRFTRRLILEGRHAVVRGNVYYWGYRLGRQGVSFVRQRGKSVPQASGFRPLD